MATSVEDTRISVSAHRLVIPEVLLTGAMAVVMVIPGLLTELTEPATGALIIEGTSTTITTQVRMMCGCLIDNLFWPAADFNVQAIISNGAEAQTLTLSYTATPEDLTPYAFSAFWRL